MKAASKDWSVSGAVEQVCQAVSDCGEWYADASRADDVRFCRWDGQSADGRKHASEIGSDPFPWDNAHDTRVYLADAVVNEQKMVMTEAFWGAQVQPLPATVDDSRAAHTVQLLLKWMLRTKMLGVLASEVELIADWRQHYGLCLTGVFWKQELQWTDTTVTVAELEAMALEAQGTPDGQLIANFLDQLYAPEAEEALAPLVRQVFTRDGDGSSDLTLSEAKQVVRDLAETGTAQVPTVEVSVSRPDWRALMPYVDVVFPRATYDIQQAPFVAMRDMVSEGELRGRIEAEGYDKVFVEKALEHKGQRSRLRQDDFGLSELQYEHLLGTESGEDERDLVELWAVYYRTSGRKGISEIRCKVIHPDVMDHVGKDERFDYDHGQLPFVAHVRERTKRRLLDSRGVSSLLSTLQMEIKTQRDATADRADIAVSPMMKTPHNQGKLNMLIGPGVKIPERRPNTITWMDPPRYDVSAKDVEENVMRDVEFYFGILNNWSKTSSKDRQQLHGRHLVQGWLNEMKQVLHQTFALMQQYMNPMMVARVTGDPSPVSVSRSEIQGSYDIMLNFDVRNLDPDFIQTKLDMVTKLLVPLDTMGQLKRGPLLRMVGDVIDPWMADQIIGDESAAQMSEVEDEQNNIVKMLNGIEPAARENGQNYPLRKQVLEQAFQQNPMVAALARQPDDPRMQLFENRYKHLSHMIQQGQNAQIGRTGMEPTEMMQAPSGVQR